jgi:hypothetical protein
MIRAIRLFAMVPGFVPVLWLLLCWPGASAFAEPAPFDLAGPAMRVVVARHGVTLPIASVPQLSPGDAITVRVMLPATETARYLLVAAFLRDPTNPPPDGWFFRSETWKPAGRGGGALTLTVPEGANHLALFLAPATGGDFATLRKAVQARPGAFIRAAQDLEQASLDRSRFEAYLAAIRAVSATRPEKLAHDAPVIASSLRIKINEECLQRQAEYQAACLLDAKQAVVLGGDGAANGNAVTGAATDLVMNLSATPAGGAGTYSPYIGAIKDIVGIFGAMHSARYQYIPALGLGHGDTLALVLNTPPSFVDPKSVLMVAMPAVRPVAPPVPHHQTGAIAPCLEASEPLVPLTVTPLYFATSYAHDLTLRLHIPNRAAIDLPVVSDPVRGGLTIAAGAALSKELAGPVAAQLHGMWGFEPFAGPEVMLETAGDWQWRRKDPGRDETPLVLDGAASACVTGVTVTVPHGRPHAASWKVAGPDEIAVTLPTKEDRHEQLTVTIEGPQGTSPATLTVAPPAKAPPPAARIIARISEPAAADAASVPAIQLDDGAEVPANARLDFTLKADAGERFTGREAVEVATAGSDTMVHLTVGNGLTMVDQTVMVVSLTPSQALGSSAYGPLRARLVRGDAAGDWLAVGTLVRLPRLKALDCPADPAAKCTLRGEALYLLASVSASREFDTATSIPEGYPGTTLAVVRPVKDSLFVRLHDAPELINRLVPASTTAGR